MKKVLLIIALIAIMLTIFCGCTAPAGPAEGEMKEPPNNTEYQVLLNSGSCFVYTFEDENTGVWYISTSEGVTPRLNSDGSLYTDKNR